MGLFRGTRTTTRAEKINSIQATTCEFGTPVPYVFGRCCLSPNLINYQDFTTKEKRTTVKAGKSKSTQIDYMYYAYLELALGNSPIDDSWRTDKIMNIWVGDTKYNSISELNNTNGAVGAGLNIIINNSSPTNYMSTKHPNIAVGYPNLCYLYGNVYLGTNNASIPSYKVEIQSERCREHVLDYLTTDFDSNIAEVIVYLMQECGIPKEKIDAQSAIYYCYARGLTIATPSGKFSNQTTAQNIIKELLDLAGLYCFCSADKIKIIPKDDRKYAIPGTYGYWEPDNTVQFSINADDIIPQNDGTLINFKIKDSAEIYNQFIITFTNRANNYETESVSYEYVQDIQTNGIKSTTIDASWIHTLEKAVKIAELHAYFNNHFNKEYTFKLWQKYYMLEPGDCIEVSDNIVGINNQFCMIKSVDEDSNGIITVVAEPRNFIADTTSINVETVDYNLQNYNINPSNTKEPFFITPPAELTTNASGVEVWLAIQGTDNTWGGCDVYISDSDSSYNLHGVQSVNSNIGYLTAECNETETELQVQFTNINAVDLSYINTYQSLFLDGEFIQFNEVELIGNNQYKLKNCIRGSYNSTPAYHYSNAKFALLDSNIYVIQLTQNYLNKNMFVKLPSFNVFQKNNQEISDVNYYTYTVKNYDIPNVSNLNANVNTDNSVYVNWTPPAYRDYSLGVVYIQQSGSEYWQLVGTDANNYTIPSNVFVTDKSYNIAVCTKDNKGNIETPEESTKIMVYIPNI